ncbi:hypothetical protein BC834DRAFT_512077 [Gloeopeniophorella convolvens]|nr:hypothetical protein BC834DRAFT_512077 [Gloeopeniophorella convolvens]
MLEQGNFIDAASTWSAPSGRLGLSKAYILTVCYLFYITPTIEPAQPPLASSLTNQGRPRVPLTLNTCQSMISNESALQDNRSAPLSSQRPPKRRRMSGATDEGTHQSKQRITWRRPMGSVLQGIFKLPVELIQEIFIRLHPRDIVSLARVSKTFRHVLTSPEWRFVWRIARQEAPGLSIPKPPEDMCEPTWANLLFGPAICWTCGSRKSVDQNFALRRRVCRSCKLFHLVNLASIEDECPDLDNAALTTGLLPHTLGAYKRNNSGTQSCKYYWKADLYETELELRILESEWSLGVPDSENALSEFCKNKKQLADAVMQNIHTHKEWVTRAARERRVEDVQRKYARYERIKRWLVEAGYQMADIVYNGRVEAQVIRSSVSRATELAKAAAESEKAVTRLTNAMEAFLPLQKFYLPPLDVVLQSPCLQTFFMAGREFNTGNDRDHAVNALHRDLSNWMTVRRDACIDKLHRPDIPPKDMRPMLLSDPLVSVIRPGRMPNYAGCLELATSVFVSKEGSRDPKVYIGRDLCHAWKVFNVDTFDFSSRGASVSATLLQQFGLPASTSAQHLDICDWRFICGNCTIDSVLSWRSCVQHFTFADRNTHILPKFYPLEIQDVRLASPPFVWSEPGNLWLCNHCSSPGSQCASKSKLLIHLRLRYVEWDCWSF